MDVTTQEVFAADGVPGVAGGDGMGIKAGEEIPAPDVVYKGVTYKGGVKNPEVDEKTGGDVNYQYGYRTARSLGGYGGGAAAGADGEMGGPPGDAAITSSGATSTAGRGADGADAVAPEKPAAYGTGGDGGNGGGGGGIGSAGYTSSRMYYSSSKPPVPDLRSYAAERSVGGKASPGADGGDGCILVFFGVPKTYVSGPVKDKYGRMVLDRLGRRIIV